MIVIGPEKKTEKKNVLIVLVASLTMSVYLCVRLSSSYT